MPNKITCDYASHPTVKCSGFPFLTAHDDRGCRPVCLAHATWLATCSMAFGHSPNCAEYAHAAATAIAARAGASADEATRPYHFALVAIRAVDETSARDRVATAILTSSVDAPKPIDMVVTPATTLLAELAERFTKLASNLAFRHLANDPNLPIAMRTKMGINGHPLTKLAAMATEGCEVILRATGELAHEPTK